MIAASKEGDKIIRFIDAKKINDGSNREDLKAVYTRRITSIFMNRASKTLGRCIKDSLLQMSYENCYFADQVAKLYLFQVLLTNLFQHSKNPNHF